MIFKFMQKPKTPPVFWALMLFWAILPGDVLAAIDDVREIVIRSSFGSSGNIIQIAEVLAIDAIDNTDVALSALGATAIAKQTYQGNSLLGAANTIDGISSPGAADGSYYHSADESDQWLKITLPADKSLKQIELVGRGSCCSDRDIFDVTVLNANGDVLARRFHLDADNATHKAVIDFDGVDSSHTSGQWGEVMEWPLVAVSMASLPDGRILTYSGSERRTWPTTEQTYSATWNPADGSFSETLHTGHNMFCGTMSMLDDGRVFVAGGRNASNSPWTSAYNYRSDNWTQLENLASGGRWYATTLALGDGNVLTAMGSSTNVRNPDLWSPVNGVRVLNGIDFISMRQRHNENGRENAFPLLSQAPNGNIYHFWDTTENHFISYTGNGSATTAQPDTDHNDHAGGVHVMYDVGRLLVSGTNDGSWGGNSSELSDKAFTIDLNGSEPVIRSTSDMNFVRKFHQMIPLPTGEVLTVGGNNTGSKFTDNGSIHDSEIWNPQTGAWRTTAALSVPRDYHSTALLMTDGRVITAGGGYHPGDPNSGGTHADAQIYSPAYLFNSDGSLADRPVVESELQEVNYGDSLSVTTTGNIDYFSLVKMSATTHAINTDARHFRPSFSAAGENRFDIVIHDNPNVATPGYWMLFAVDTNGVPSVAEIVRIASDVIIDTNNGEPSVVSPIETSAVETMNNVRYDISATGSNLTYRWNFGDGSGDSALVSQNTIYHFYSLPGRYLVNVTVITPAGLETVASFYQVVHASLPENKPKQSSGLLELTTRNELWSVNPDNNSVAITSTSSLTRDALVPVGVNPRTLAQAPDGRVWVINKDDASISVIDPDSRSIQQTIQLDRASRPHGIVFNDHSAYITLEALKTVVQLNATTGIETNRLVTGYAPKHISLNANGDRMFVSDYVSPAIPGEAGLAPALNSANGHVNVLSTSASTLVFEKTINLQYSNRDVSEHSGPGVPNYLGPVIISPLGDYAWVPSKQDNIVAGERRGGAGISFDQTVRAVTSKIDLSTETETLSARIDHDNSSVASHGAYGPYGHILFVSLEGNRQVALIDTSTNLEYARFDVGLAPQSLLLSDSGERLYVHNFMDRSVAVVDVSDVVERATSQVETEAIISTVASEQLSAEILRGKQLFYDARDDRLAALDYMACAACHNDGENDGRTWDFSGLGEGLRNTNNLRGNGKTTGRLHWSANFDEVQDFETPIRSFAGGKGLMEDADFQTGSRSNAFGLPKAGVSADLDALAAYVESLNTALPSPHRNPDGSLTPAGVSGRSLFEQSGCGVCHAGDKFTDSTSGLLHDVGTHNANSGERSGGALTGIDTPTLLGSWKTAPYLHNGSAATLLDAIQAHSNVTVSAAQAGELAAFVQQIDSTEPAVSSAVPENPDTGTPQFDNAYSTYANINIDGNMAEWPLSASIGIDPQDSTGGANQLDFERGWLAHDDRTLYIRYDNHTPNDTRVTWGYSVSIDVDGEENGFNDGYLPIGVDFLVEGQSIYRYTGDGSNWSWAWMADFPLRLNGRSAELAIERSLLGNPETFSFFFYADNNAIGGTSLDFLPDAVPDGAAEVATRFLNYAFDAEPAIDEQPPVNGPDQAEVVHNVVSALEFDGNVSDWNAFQSFGADPDDVFESGSTIDFLRGWGGHDESHFYFAWSNDGPGSLTWGNAIYVDTDLRYSTGFRGFLNDSPIGIDYLLEADGLYRYSGNGTSWSWVFVAGTEVVINGNSLELRVPIALLDSAETIDLFFYGDNTPVNTNEVDFYPDGVADESLNNAQRHFRYSRNAALATAQPDAVVTGVSQ